MLAYSSGGSDDWKKCTDLNILEKFAHIRMAYATGDTFNMEPAVLPQSKLIIMAMLMSDLSSSQHLLT